MSVPAPAPITLEAFEQGLIPLEHWNHRAHLTIAYLLLRAHSPDAATARMRRGVQAFNAANGIRQTFGPSGGGYHDTLTVAWMRVLSATISAYGPAAGLDDFLAQHPHLLSKVLLRLYYTRERIMSDQARREFVEPDLSPLPALRVS